MNEELLLLLNSYSKSIWIEIKTEKEKEDFPYSHQTYGPIMNV